MYITIKVGKLTASFLLREVDMMTCKRVWFSWRFKFGKKEYGFEIARPLHGLGGLTVRRFRNGKSFGIQFCGPVRIIRDWH